MPKRHRVIRDDRNDAPSVRAPAVVRLGALLCCFALFVQPLTGLLHLHAALPDARACATDAPNAAAAHDDACGEIAAAPTNTPTRGHHAPDGSTTNHDDHCVVCQLLASTRAAPTPDAPSGAAFDAPSIGVALALDVRALTHDVRTDARPRAPPTL